VVIHVEVQSQAEEDFPRRMYAYNYRLYDKYDQPAVSLAVLADDRPDWRPRQFRAALWGCTAGIDYPVVKLLDYAAQDEVLERCQPVRPTSRLSRRGRIHTPAASGSCVWCEACTSGAIRGRTFSTSFVSSTG